MPLPSPTSHPLLMAVARELTRLLGGRVQDHVSEARRILREALNSGRRQPLGSAGQA